MGLSPNIVKISQYFVDLTTLVDTVTGIRELFRKVLTILHTKSDYKRIILRI